MNRSFTFGAPRAIAPRTPTEAEALMPVGNALLELGYLADAIEAATARRDRIVARLDDPTVAATREQRAEAEARAGALWGEAQRHRKEFRRLALRFPNLWDALPPELQAFVRDEAFPMRWYDGLAAIVEGEHTLTGMAVWRELLNARRQAA